MITFDHRYPNIEELANAVGKEYFSAKEKLQQNREKFSKKEYQKRTKELFMNIVNQCLTYRPSETVYDLMRQIKAYWKAKKLAREKNKEAFGRNWRK